MSFTQRFEYAGSDTGLSPYVSVYDAAGSALVARTQTGISNPTGTNRYVYDATLDDTYKGKPVTAVWDEGTQSESSIDTLIATGNNATLDDAISSATDSKNINVEITGITASS